MAALAEDLRTFLADDATVAGYVTAGGVARIHQNQVPQDKALPFIFFRQAGVRYSEEVNATAGSEPFERTFDIECVSDDIDEAADLAEAVRNRLAYFRGSGFGTVSVQAVFVEEHDEDYVPRGTDGDYRLFVEHLSARVIPV